MLMYTAIGIVWPMFFHIHIDFFFVLERIDKPYWYMMAEAIRDILFKCRSW